MKKLSQLLLATLLLILAAPLILGCSSEDDPTDSVRTFGQAMTAADADVLGFETPTADWSSNNGSIITSSATSSQGSAALSVVPNGYTLLESISMQALGGASTEAQIDILVPASPSWGELRLILKAPSEDVYWMDLGGVSLSGLSAGSFHTLSMPLSDEAQNLLDNEDADISLVVVLNVANLGAPLLLDNLRVTTSSVDLSVDASVKFSLGLPRETEVGQFVLSGTDGVILDSRTSVGGPLEPASVAGFSPVGVAIAAEAMVYGDIYSTSDVTLMSQATVEGDITSRGYIVEQDDTVVVSGSRRQGGAVRQQESGWEVDWPGEHRDSVNREPDAPNYELASGAYGDVRLASRATLTLRAGTFFLESLIVEPEAKLRVDTRHGPVVVYVRNELTLNVSLTFIGDDENGVLIGYLGSAPAIFREAIVATVVAPNSALELRRPSSELPHRGAFFGKIVHVFSDAIVLHEPFSFNTLCASGTHDGSQCVGEAGTPATFVESSLWLPKGVSPYQMMVGARRGLDIGEGALLTDEDRLLTNATGQTNLGTNAETPGIASVGGVVANEGVQVSGDLRADAAIDIDPSTSVSGTVDPAASISPPTSYRLRQVFPDAVDGNLLIASGRSKIIVPGQYGTIRVNTGGKIYLISGQYSADDFIMESGAELVIMPDSGWVQVDVANQLALQGTVSSLGEDTADVIFLYGGPSPVVVAGEFAGAVIAPRAHMDVMAGPHAAILYSDTLSVDAGVQISSISLPWEKLLDEEQLEEASVVVGPRGDLPGSLKADSNLLGTISNSTSFRFVVPGRIPVGKGNAGNGTATISLTRADGTSLTCAYRGGASVAHPIDLLDIALGREFIFESCSDGTVGGAIEEVTDVSIEVNGDSLAGDGTTGVNLPIDKGCEGDLVPPISLAESRELIENFQWPLPGPLGSLGSVPSEIDGKPSLYYTSVYVTKPDHLEALDRMLVHWDKRPLFLDEWPTDWDNVCGTIHYDHDGEGTWVWAIMPGDMYNAILNARYSTEIEPAQRELFPAVRLLEPPTELATTDGALDVDLLLDGGFEYRGLTDLPDPLALEEALYPGGVADLIADAAKWIFDKAKKAFQGLASIFNFTDRIYGTVKVKLDVDLLFGDPTFAAGTRMQRAWGPYSGGEIAPQGARINFWTTSIRWTNPFPFKRLAKDRLSLSGIATLKVPKGSSGWGSVDFRRVCIELENDAGFMSTFLGASSVCNDTFSDGDFGHFKDDSNVEWELSSRKTRHLTEVTDSYHYLRDVVGEQAKQAKVLIGPNAFLLAGFQEGAVAYCFGYGDLAMDTAVATLSTIGIVFPGSFIAGVYLTILANTDIVITDNSSAERTHGVVTHEYGHYALCDLVRKNGENIVADTILTLDTIAGGGGNPDPDEEARVVNEAFADFFAMQIAGGVNYRFLRESLGDPGMTDSLADGFSFSTSHPGLDLNIFAPTSARPILAIGRLSTLMQDLFDGRPYQNAGPTSGESWVEVAGTATPMLVHREDAGIACANFPDSPACRTGDPDLESVMLGGASIRLAVFNFQKARKLLGGYRVAAMEEGLITTALDATNWCQTCLLAAPHFQDFDVNPATVDPLIPASGNPYGRDLIEACQDGSLADYLGPPPKETRELNAYSCEPCPAGTGMGRDGTCVGCPVDTVVDWSTATICQETLVPYSNASDDWCPESFIVDVINADSAYPVHSIGINVAEDIADETACALSYLRGSVARSLGTEMPSIEYAFDVPGTPQDPSLEEVSPLGLCGYLGPNSEVGLYDLNFEVSGTRIVTTTLAGPYGANVLVRADPNDCAIVVK